MPCADRLRLKECRQMNMESKPIAQFVPVD